jgi:epoxyqueuosine reductase
MATSVDRDALLAAGRDAGFAACGIADCSPSEQAERLDAWLARGAHGSMAWMERTAAVRKDLRQKWDWAASALVGASRYLSAPADRAGAPGLLGHVARYARGADYHDVLKSRLHAWGDALEALAGRPVRRAGLVDTSAVIERELAVRAGIGWIGKNTCLIGPGGDSWRFIGVLLTDLPLAPTAARAAERCGSCRACLDACPTGAFDGPWQLDARRCISYLTIEHRGTIDPGLRAPMGEWLFGCDVCQEVCPWNRRVEPVADGAFEPSPALTGLSLAEIVRLDEAGFRERFRRTPLGRPKRAGLVRNALIAGANAGDPEVMAAARDLVDDEDDGVRDAARWVLERRASAPPG